ncbi:MAG: hypothetical protein IKC91_00880 [Clostridia bacterium]|nr:hypothetical protein [Clostridia bacterium]
MKKLTRFIALLLCAIMTLCLFSFAGCHKEKLKEIVAAIERQEVKALALDAGFSMQIKQPGTTQSLSFSLDSKMNIEKEELDLAMSTSVKQKYQTESAYVYGFLREETLFTYNDTAAVSDWTDKYLKVNDLSASFEAFDQTMAEILSQLDVDLATLTEMEEDSMSDIGETLSFFDFMGSLSIKGNVITIDLNKCLYKFSRDLISVLKDLENDTTLADLLKHRAVKKYLDYFLREQKAEDVQSDLKDLLAEIPEGVLPSTVRSKLNDLANVEPKKSEAATDYLLRLLRSEEFDAVMQAMGLDFSVTETTFKQALGDSLVKAFGRTWKEDLIDALEDFTQKEMKLSFDEVSLTLSNLKMEYVLNKDNTLSSAEFTSKVVVKADDVQVAFNLSYGFNCYKQAIALTDISKAKVQGGTKLDRFDGVFEDEFSMNLTVQKPVYIPSVQVGYSPDCKNGQIVDWKARIFDPVQGMVSLDTDYNPQAQTLSFVLELDEDLSCEVVLNIRIYEYDGDAYVEVWSANDNASVYSYKYLCRTSPVYQTVAQYLASN